MDATKAKASHSPPPLATGQTIYHPVFGKGEITAIEPGSQHARAGIRFEGVGYKWIVADQQHLRAEPPPVQAAVAAAPSNRSDKHMGPEPTAVPQQIVRTTMPSPRDAQAALSKRRFLSLLTKALPLTLIPSSARPDHVQTRAARKLTILETRIAGFAYYAGPQNLHHMAPEQPLLLKRETENPYDAKAIAVYWQQQKIGFVPRRHNAALSKLLDANETITAAVAEIQTQQEWEPLFFHVILEA